MPEAGFEAAFDGGARSGRRDSIDDIFRNRGWFGFAEASDGLTDASVRYDGGRLFRYDLISDMRWCSILMALDFAVKELTTRWIVSAHVKPKQGFATYALRPRNSRDCLC